MTDVCLKPSEKVGDLSPAVADTVGAAALTHRFFIFALTENRPELTAPLLLRQNQEIYDN